MQNTNIDYKKLLKGEYEVNKPLEELLTDGIVPDFGYNIINFLNPLYQPIIDEFYIKNGGSRPIWPGKKSFVVCLTHDVDHVSLYSFLQWLRLKRYLLSRKKAILDLLKGSMSSLLELVMQNKKFFFIDPIHCYEKWIAEEEKMGVKSTFFFSPGWSNITLPHENDCLYELNDRIVYDKRKCTVIEMIKEIDCKGWEIGLHPSCLSYNNLDELKRQKQKFEKATDIEVLSVRQHHLYFDIRKTPSIQAQAGFKYDSTLGFNDNVGFRFGSCYPWYLKDLKSDRALPILEIPLIIQDGAMLKHHKGLRLDPNTAFQYVAAITEKVDRVGGVLTLLWHPSSIQSKNSWLLYLKILRYLKKKDPWFATIKQVGNWWALKNKDDSLANL